MWIIRRSFIPSPSLKSRLGFFLYTAHSCFPLLHFTHIEKFECDARWVSVSIAFGRKSGEPRCPKNSIERTTSASFLKDNHREYDSGLCVLHHLKSDLYSSTCTFCQITGRWTTVGSFGI